MYIKSNSLFNANCLKSHFSDTHSVGLLSAYSYNLNYVQQVK